MPGDSFNEAILIGLRGVVKVVLWLIVS